MNRHTFTTAPAPSARNPWTHPDAYLRPVDLLTAEVFPSETGESKTVWRGYAMAAARVVLKGAAWSEEDRVECAGEIAAAVMGARHAARHGRPADVLRYMDYAERFPVTARRMEDAIPKTYATMTRLTNLGANWRRSVERSRDRDQRAVDAATSRGGFTTNGALSETYAEGAELHGWTVHAATPRHAAPMANAHGSARDVLRYMDAIETVRDTYRAWPAAWSKYLRETTPCPLRLGGPRVQAMDMLAALGLPRMGAAYPAAYAAAWSARGLSGDDLAAVMGAARKTAEKRVLRSAATVPSKSTHTYIEHADIIGVTVEVEGAHHGATNDHAEPRTTRSAEGCTCRATDDAAAAPTACPVHPMTTRRVRTVRPWDGSKRAEWTNSLRPQARARMAAAAALSRGHGTAHAEKAGRVR